MLLPVSDPRAANAFTPLGSNRRSPPMRMHGKLPRSAALSTQLTDAFKLRDVPHVPESLLHAALGPKRVHRFPLGSGGSVPTSFSTCSSPRTMSIRTAVLVLTLSPGSRSFRK